MKPVIIIAIAFVFLFVPINVSAISDQDDQPELYFSGANGSMNSTCDNLLYHINANISSITLTQIKIEIIDPNGKVVGVYEDITKGSLDIQIDVDYTISGKYLIHFHYKGEIYEEDYSWEEYYIPNHDAQIQCLVENAINKGEHLKYYSLNTNPYGGISRIDTESNRETLKNILGDKFEHYEPILFANFYAVYVTRPDTTFALEEMDKLLILLNNYTHSTTSYNNQMAESQIKSMDISDEDKADVLYERRLSYELSITNYERINKQFVDTTKQSYLDADLLDAARIKAKIEHAKYLEELEEEERQVQKAKDKIIEELKGDEVVIPSPVKQQSKIESDIVCGKGTVKIDNICQVEQIEEEKEIPIEKVVDTPVENPSKKSVNWFSSLFDWLGGLFK